MEIKKLLFFVGLFLLLCLIYSLIEPYLLEQKEIKIKSSQIPKSLSGKRVVFLTDIHHSLFFSEKRFKKLIEKVNSLSPDLVLLGGDYADGGEKHLKKACELLGKINPKMQRPVAVIGNHDIDLNKDEYIKCFEDNNIKVLDNDNFLLSEEYGKKFYIAGIDDYAIGKPDLDKALKNIQNKDYTLLISHSPDVSENLDGQDVDLVLSGHTHGGQITFFGLWAPITMSKYGQKYVSGETETSFGKTITSNGIGTVLLPMRFFAKPQIILLDIETTPTTTIKIEDKEINVEIAQSKQDLQTGLMHRKSLCANCGMLFVFSEEKQHTFWMKNTLIPLDIIFINKNKEIVDIKKAVPCPDNGECTTYKPKKDCLYVLEVNSGTFNDSDIGKQLNFEIE